MTGPAGEGRTIAPIDDPLLIDELLGFRAQFHTSEADGQPIRLLTGRADVEQVTNSLRAVLWDASVRIKALAAELAAARAEAKVAAARNAALEEAAASIIQGYSVANWSDVPDQQMTGLRISHGQVRALCRAARTSGGPRHDG